MCSAAEHFTPVMPLTTTETDVQRTALQEVERRGVEVVRLEQQLAAARRVRDASVVYASKRGCSMRAIARRAQLGASTVHEIVTPKPPAIPADSEIGRLLSRADGSAT